MQRLCRLDHGKVGGIFRAGYKNSCTYTCVYVYASTLVRAFKCAFVRMFVCMYVRLRVNLHYSVCICLRVCACVRARAYGVVWNVVLRRTQRPGPRSV
jgi:hypothetical protein